MTERNGGQTLKAFITQWLPILTVVVGVSIAIGRADTRLDHLERVATNHLNSVSHAGTLIRFSDQTARLDVQAVKMQSVEDQLKQISEDLRQIDRRLQQLLIEQGPAKRPPRDP
jgi:hypothetical protein